MNAEEMWSSSVSKHLSPSSGDQSKPKQTLKEVDSVLTQSSVTARSSYRMPPGTSRTKKCTATLRETAAKTIFYSFINHLSSYYLMN